MARGKNSTNLTELLLKCVAEPDPMLSMLEWLCVQLMEAEVSGIVGAEKNAHCPERKAYRCGYRPRRLDTRMGTMYLMVPKVRNGGYIPFFVTEHRRSEAALIQVVQEAFVYVVSTRKMERLTRSLGIENMSRSQVSEMTKGLNDQVREFRIRSLADTRYPVIWTDAIYEKVRIDGRVVSMAVLIVCGVNEQGHREVLAVEPMPEESRESYSPAVSEPVAARTENAVTGCFRRQQRVGCGHTGELSRGRHGSGARCISCGIFRLMWRRRRRNPLPHSLRKFGRLQRPSLPAGARKTWPGNTGSGFQRR